MGYGNTQKVLYVSCIAFWLGDCLLCIFKEMTPYTHYTDPTPLLQTHIPTPPSPPHLPIMHTHILTHLHIPKCMPSPPPPPQTHTHTSFFSGLYIPTHLHTHTWMHIHTPSPLHTHTYQFLQETVSVLAAFQWTHFPAVIQNTTVPSHNTVYYNTGTDIVQIISYINIVF